MKHKSNFGALFAVLLLGSVMSFGGCATVMKKTGTERAEKTSTSMTTVDGDIKQASAQIDATTLSLNELIRTGQSPSAQPADVKTAFNTYSDNVSKMNDAGKRLNKHIDQMNAQGNAYFTEWAKQGATYTNPDIQRLSEERRVHLSKTFTNIASSSAGVRGSLNAYLSEIGQIRNYLSNDLTPAGISAISPVAKSAETDGNDLKNSFRPVETAIQQARTEMTPGGAAAGGGPGPSPRSDVNRP